MRHLIDVGLTFVDYVKAELESARHALLNLGIALGLILTAVLFLACALVLLLYAVFLGFISIIDPRLAVIATALVSFGFAGVLLWIAFYKGGR